MTPVGGHFGRYELRALLGEGGMGKVYLAYDPTLGRLVALKILPSELASDPDRNRRFIQEAKLASALNHPHILTIYEIGTIGDTHFMATEFVEGVTLRQRIAQGALPPVEVLDVAIQVAGALAAAHAAGVVHRDIKPENIMVRADGYVKVLDFGLAKLTAAPATEIEAATLLKTRPGLIMGTPSYMSPEQARGLETDVRTDIWSLGVVLHEMLTGAAPFAGETVPDVLVSVITRDPPSLDGRIKGAPAGLEKVIRHALAKEKADRYASMGEMLSVLQRLRHQLGWDDSRGAAGGTIGPVTLLLPRAEAVRAPRRKTVKALDSLAILPLRTVDGDTSLEYLSEGISESIINNLSQLPRLRVIPRSTAFRWKGSEADLKSIGSALGVRVVMTGYVLRLEDHVVVGIELDDVGNEQQLWGGKYNFELGEILKVQEEIADQISESLKLKLSYGEKERLRKRPTENTVSYQLYLKGRYYWNKRTEEGLQKAIEHFRQAIEEDPGYALAYAGLADCYNLLSCYGILPPKEAFPRARAAAAKALEFDSRLAEAHTALAVVKSCYERDWTGAERALKRAVQLSPNYASARQWYAEYLTQVGRLDEAVAEIEHAIELDPLSLIINSVAGWIYYFAREHELAREQLQKTLELDARFARAHLYLGQVYMEKRMVKNAVEEFRQAAALAGGSTETQAMLAYACAAAGDQAESRGILDDLLQQRYAAPYLLALIHTGLGDYENALRELEHADEIRDEWLVYAKVDPKLDPLRSDPRFVSLLQRIGLSP